MVFNVIRHMKPRQRWAHRKERDLKLGKLGIVKVLRNVAATNGLRRCRHLVRSEDGAASGPFMARGQSKQVVWEEPNRANTPELQIGRSGGRYSTVTGVWWLDETRFIAAHRSGMMLAVFSKDHLDGPVWSGPIDHVSDDIAAKQITPSTWEIAVSGCWDCIYSRYHLRETDAGFEIDTLDRLAHGSKDFCHGVAYDASGGLCYSIHTGKRPRFGIGRDSYKLPAPWGVRDLCHDPVRHRYLAVAVSANPRRTAYSGVQTSLWTLDEGDSKWACMAAYNNVHSDALDVWNGHVWIPDQVGNRLLALNADTGAVDAIFDGDALDFPHGLGISAEGVIAVTNYGSSSIILAAADELLGSVGVSGGLGRVSTG